MEYFSFQNIVIILLQFVALLVAIIGHEIMHGMTSLVYGDDTAKNANRLTLNPIPHIDLMGSIIVPILLIVFNSGFMFGWAKPVPININTIYKNKGYKGCIMVAMAGILYNLFFAFVAVLLLKIGIKYGIASQGGIIHIFLSALIISNIMIGVFNLIPIPPLDGSKALAYLFLIFKKPFLAIFYYKIEKYGSIILLILMFIPYTSGILRALFSVVLYFFLLI